MIPVLLILGAGAALEIKRLTQRGGDNGQARAHKEQHLKELLQALKRELEKEKEERAAEAARNETLAREAAELAAQRDSLQATAEELQSENEALRQRTEALALSAESLLQDKGAALQQVDQLRAEAERGEAAAEEAAAQLRRDVADALEAFSAGELDADGFLEELAGLGVHVDASADALTLTSAPQKQDAPQAAAPITGSWSHSMRLVCGSSERMAQLITAGSLQQEGAPGRAVPASSAALREAGVTPRLGLVNAVAASAATAMAVLTPRLFANSDNLPTDAAPKQSAPAAVEADNEAKPGQAKAQPGSYSLDATATSLLFIRPPKAGGPSKKPPMVPRLGLNLDLGGSAGPASERAMLTSIDFPSDAAGQEASTSLIIKS